MSLNDPLANALSKIHNAEKVGKPECAIKPISKILKKVLNIMKLNHYIGDFKEVDDGKGGFIVVNLIGGLNKCGAIKPNYPVGIDDLTKFEMKYLLAKGFGILILSTSQGIMTHLEAKKKNTGGRLVAYCY